MNLPTQWATHKIRDQVSVLNIAEGFFHSNIIFALLKLRIFELIGEEEKSLDELAVQVGARTETLARLLNAGVMLKLLESADHGRYRLSRLSRSVLLPSAEEGYLGHWIDNLAYFQNALMELPRAVKNSAPSVPASAHLGADPEQTEGFIMAMHDYAALRGRELARYLDTTGCEKVLDLGCGSGTYAFHLGRANENLKIYLLDLPAVLEVARKVQAQYGLKNEVHYVPGNVLSDPVPGEYDLILISNTLHMLGHAASRDLIHQIYKSIKPGGSLVIQAQFLRNDRAGERWPVLLDLIQLCITEQGANHSVEQTSRWMEEAGFRNITFCPMNLLNSNSFLRGYRP